MPPAKKEEPLRLNGELLARTSKLPDVIKIRLKESAVAHQIATGLYKSPQAGFREVYSNERRAACTAQQKFGARPRIEVTVDTEQRRLTIQGHDSLGITAQVFTDVLRWMGRTTNNDETQIGQFGWGFFAIWTLADSIRLETYARETGERYGVTAKDAGAFILLPDEEVTIQEYGTALQLNLKKDVNLPKLADWIEEISRYSDIETHLTITKDLVVVTDARWGFKHVALEKGRKRLDSTIKKRLQQQVSEHCEYDRVLYKIEYDTSDYYFYGVIGGDDRHAHLFGGEEDREALLLGVPIEAPDVTSIKWPLTSWTLNIKNERKYPPTPDRDRFLENALKPIIDELRSNMEATLAELRITSFDDYRRSPWKGIYTSLTDSSAKWPDEQTRKVANLLSLEVISPNDEHKECTAENEPTVRSYRWHRHHRKSTYTQIRLSDVVARSGRLFYYEMPRRENGREILLVKKMEAAKTILRTQHQDAEVFTRISPDHSWTSDQRPLETRILLRLLKEVGGNVNPDAPGEAQKQKKKLGKNWRRICGLPERRPAQMQSVDWPVHKRFERGRVEPKRFKMKNIPVDTLRVRSHLKAYIAALELVESKYGVTKDHKRLRGGLSLDTFLKSMKDKTVPTNHGQVTFDQIAGNQKKITIYITEKTEMLQIYTPSEAGIMVITEGDDAFELMAYLIAKQRQYVTIRHPDAESFHERTGMDLEEIIGTYPSTSDSEKATIAYIGASAIKTPQVQLLLLQAIRSTHSTETAQTHLDRALALDRALTSKNAPVDERTG
jgi:hypothetical protein